MDLAKNHKEQTFAVLSNPNQGHPLGDAEQLVFPDEFCHGNLPFRGGKDAKIKTAQAPS